ncbi:MAG: rod shape-determining protein MreD [Lachnospiraceae bacterium]|nr:rod shape-determining protein MreD [Lachnospiraceae bacterium]
MIRSIVVLIEIIISYLLQSSVFSYFELAGVVPDILLILVVSTAFFRGQKAGMLTGFLAGLLMDLCMGDVVGICAIFYMLIGFLNGYSNKIFDREDYLLPMALITVSELLYNLLYYFFVVMLQGNLKFGYYFGKIILPRVVYTLFVAILFYKLFQMLHLMLAHFENKER